MTTTAIARGNRAPLLASRLSAVEDALEAACERAGRARREVCLVAVSKTHTPDLISEAYALGVRDYGENYAQELHEKARGLAASCPEVRWHFIGRLQSNKAKLLTGVSLVHGVASQEQARALGRRAAEEEPVPFLAQVNISGEEQKNGLSPESIRRELEALCDVPGAQLMGLMAVLERGEAGLAACRSFAQVRVLRDELERRAGRSLPFLSMGMSSDYVEAISEGATHVRIGTALFGSRGQ